MAIRIGGTSIIDDDKNISNVGVVTIGTGGTTGRVQVGTGTTIFGSGNISIAGTLTALDISTPLKLVSVTPGIGSTNVDADTKIVLTFNQTITPGSGSITLRTNSASGTIQETFTIPPTEVTQFGAQFAGYSLIFTPTLKLSFVTDYYLVVPNNVIAGVGTYFSGLNVATGIGYSFRTGGPNPGDPYGGGRLICSSAGTNWVVSPYCTEINRTWPNRGNGVTVAQSCTGCTGWFVPSLGQFQNPGRVCKAYWDQYSNGEYWSDSQYNNPWAYAPDLFNFNECRNKGEGKQIRTFRCVAY